MKRILLVFALLAVAVPIRAQEGVCSEIVSLRNKACPAGTSCTNKASTLTWAELDGDLANIAELCNDTATILVNTLGGTGVDSSSDSGVCRVSTGSWTFDADISHLATSTSANLLGVLSDETGTGVVVFGTSPTITSPTISTSVALPADAVDALTEIADLCAANEGVFRNSGDSAWECSAPAGTGDVVASGTPVDSQVGVWTSSTGLEGGTNFTFDGTDLVISGATGITVRSESTSPSSEAGFEAKTDASTWSIMAGLAGVDELAFRDDTVEKFAVTTSGIDVTGTITVSGTVDGVDVADHSARHDENGADELLVEGLGTACTVGQVAASDGSGGLDCSSAGSGDTTSVGDCASGACFDGTQGTVLTFFDAGGNATLDYDGTLLLSDVQTFTSAAGGADQVVLGIRREDAGAPGEFCEVGLVASVSDEGEFGIAIADSASNNCDLGSTTTWKFNESGMFSGSDCGVGGDCFGLNGTVDATTGTSILPNKDEANVGLGGDTGILYLRGGAIGSSWAVKLNPNGAVGGQIIDADEITTWPTSNPASGRGFLGFITSELHWEGDDGAERTAVSEDATQTLTNKTINTASNTLTVAEADISDLSHTPATADISDASVTQTEFAELETIGATTISANQWTALGGIAETLTSTELNLLDGITTLSGSNTGDQDLADTVAEISDLDNDAATLSLPASTTISAFGATVIDDASAAAARTTLDVDQAGTDNSTDVTLAGTPNYITLAGQVITRTTIDIGDDTNLAAGTSLTLTGDSLAVDDDFLANDGDVGTGVFDFGGATSLEIPNGAAPTVNAAGEMAEDTTDSQLLLGASGFPVAMPVKSACMLANNLAAADDDTPMPIRSGQTIELVSAFCHCQGTCTTEADISFEYVEVGTAGPTITAVTGSVTCEDYITGDSATTLSGSTTVTALDVLRFDVDNAVSPETDIYSICVNYRLGAT